ncbi:hypothetical protein [Burkholderia vietnamiensis]|uniref:hypothetical protein n=1 Tax=Burkholderia vietnamiensis TaxID=60552 RepID=UPI000841BAB8|nr:hypothetical protein [Burkholderia vietnamiensis]AOK42557.1 hypothetical protein WL96_15490 [Burkholderia vietnamiensis]
MEIQKRGTQHLASDEPNLVASFETGFISLKGSIIGVCIKYAMFDGDRRIAHWPLDKFLQLLSCLSKYSKTHWNGSDMHRTTDPRFVVDLPARHPYHTVVDEAPTLSQDEIGASSESTFVLDFRFVDRTKSCEILSTFRNGEGRTDALPEYIAMNLFGYLESSVEALGLLEAGVGGSA